MKKEKKVVEKGYTLHITSWENDGDNYRIETMTVGTREEAVSLRDMCLTLFQSSNRSELGISNFDFTREEIAKNRIVHFMQLNPSLYQICQVEDLDDEDEVYRRCLEMAYELMGGSEYYISRVCKSCEITYSPCDVFVELID